MKSITSVQELVDAMVSFMEKSYVHNECFTCSAFLIPALPKCRQTLVITWSSLTSMHNGVLHAEHCSQR